jgi:hypothetical protein
MIGLQLGHPPAPKRFLEALGRVVLYASHMEFHVDCLYQMLNAETDQTVSGQPTARALSKQLSEMTELLQHRYSRHANAAQLLDDWKNVRSSVSDAAKARNSLIHSLHTAWPRSRTIRSFDRNLQKPDTPVQITTIEYSDIDVVCAAIHSASEMILAWQTQYIWPIGARQPLTFKQTIERL